MAKNKNKRKFKVRYIVLAMLVLFIIAVGTIAVTNWDNIQAGYTGLTTDPEEIQAKQAEKKSQLEQDLNVSDGFSEEEMQAAREAIFPILPDSLAEFVYGTDAAASSEGSSVSGADGSTSGTSENGGTVAGGGAGDTGTASGTEVSTSDGSAVNGTGSSASSGGSGTTVISGSGGGSSTVTSGTSDSDSSDSASAITRKYTAQLYALQETLQAKINSLTSSAKEEYAALPDSEKNSSSKAAIISSKLDEADSLEASSDAAVDTILSNMESELKSAGGDTSVVSQLRDYYENEKASQKAAAVAAMRG